VRPKPRGCPVKWVAYLELRPSFIAFIRTNHILQCLMDLNFTMQQVLLQTKIISYVT